MNALEFIAALAIAAIAAWLWLRKDKSIESPDDAKPKTIEESIEDSIENFLDGVGSIDLTAYFDQKKSEDQD